MVEDRQIDMRESFERGVRRLESWRMGVDLIVGGGDDVLQHMNRHLLEGGRC